jgi:hypothetical protein
MKDIQAKGNSNQYGSIRTPGSGISVKKIRIVYQGKLIIEDRCLFLFSVEVTNTSVLTMVILSRKKLWCTNNYCYNSYQAF